MESPAAERKASRLAAIGTDLLRVRAPSWAPSSPQTPIRERVAPGEHNDAAEREHLARYRFARRFCAGKTVADIACGTGYGMNILREVAASVDGYDKERLFTCDYYFQIDETIHRDQKLPFQYIVAVCVPGR